MIYYIADTHFWHSNIIRINDRPFSSIEEMNKTIIDNWNSRVTKNDIVYIVGDFGFKAQDELVKIASILNGNKTLIEGNHDSKIVKNEQFRSKFSEICQMKIINDNGRTVHLCHYPIIEWYGYFRDAYLVYGHVHNNTTNKTFEIMKNEPRALNAGVDITGFMPLTLDELIVANKVFNETH
ncbi:MAG: metallophosphoesterase family protein [Lachnospiraceae bacterium]|nr:metallophosphoesterase family protein [Lachnospiraceae bacterium]